MRHWPAVLVLVASTAAPALAQPHAWKQGTWGRSEDAALVAVETATDVVTARPSPEGDLGWVGTPGTTVRYAVEGSTLYLLDADRREHALAIVESAPKYSTEYAALGGGHYIKAVAPGGTAVTLEDDTRWDIDPRQHFAVAGWSPDDLISIRRSTDDPAFAFELDNTTHDDGTLANRRVR